jgi:hypothetical protein
MTPEDDALSDVAGQLERIANLYQQNLISHEEFTAAKQKILST